MKIAGEITMGLGAIQLAISKLRAEQEAAFRSFCSDFSRLSFTAATFMVAEFA